MTDFIERYSGLLVPANKPATASPERPSTSDRPTVFPTPWNLIHYRDLDASVRYRLESSHVAEFEALEWFGREQSGEVAFRSKADESPAASADDAERLFSGSVKWDGCANLNFHTDEVRRHFCSFNDVRKFSTLLEHAYCESARMLARQTGTWDEVIEPKPWVHSAIDGPVLQKVLEAMRWADENPSQDSMRSATVSRLIAEARSILEKNGCEIEVYC